MEEVLAQQRNTAKPMTGRLFVMSMAVVLIKLALAQILVNLAISLSGIGLLNIAFYVYAVAMLAGFMRRTVAGSVYVLKESTLTFSKMLGDSATSVVVIPRASVVSIRPVLRGERLGSCYRRVTVIDASATVGWRMRLSFWLSLVSATLARKVAGKTAFEERGYVLVYAEDGKRQACVFKPNEAFLQALAEAFPGKTGVDERTRENTPPTMIAQALERAFPSLYPYVTPLVDPKRVQQARETIAHQHRAHRTKKKKASDAAKTGEDHDISDGSI